MSPRKKLTRVRTQIGADGLTYRLVRGKWVLDVKASAAAHEKRVASMVGISDAARGVHAAGLALTATERLTPRPPHLTYEEQRMRAERLGVAAAEHEAERDAYAADLVKSEAEVERLQKVLRETEAAAHASEAAVAAGIRRTVRQHEAFIVAVEAVEHRHPQLATLLRNMWDGV